MSSPFPQHSRECTAEDGFSLIEVVVAIVLTGMLAAAALTFFVSGVSTVSESQRKQAAVMLANSAVEQARAVAPGAVDAASTSGLVRGRSKASVQTSWTAATAFDSQDTADMNIAWDPSTGLTDASQWVPLEQTRTVDSQTYTITTLIGSCYRSKLASKTADDCVKDQPSINSDDYVKLYRVRVVVKWAESQTATPRSYRLATLIDPSTDVLWNTVLKPYAYDDDLSISAGDPAQFFAIVANDEVEYNTAGTVSPIVDLATPTHGTLAVGTGSRINGVIYTPPTNTKLAGPVTSKYAVRSTSMEKSTPANITIHVLPRPFEDSFKKGPGTSSKITAELLGNDFGTENIDSTRRINVVLTNDPDLDMFSMDKVPDTVLAARERSKLALESKGLSVDANGDVQFDAPVDASAGPVVFYYYLVDDDANLVGQRFPSARPARVTIELAEDKPIAVDELIEIPVKHGPSDLSTKLDLQDLTGNPEDYAIRITDTNIGAGGQGRLSIDGSNYNAADHNEGLDVTYTQQGNSAYAVWFTYEVVSPGGQVSEERKITIHVVPKAVGESISLKRNTTADFVLFGNDLPSDASVQLVNVSNPSCATRTVADAASGKVTITAPNGTNTCTMTYALQVRDFPEIVSNKATVTIQVTRR